MRQPKHQPFAPKLSLQRLTTRSQGLRKLIQQAKEHSNVSDQFNSALPKMFQGQFQINSFEGHALILTCHSASLMTRFRLSQNDIIQQFNNIIRPNYVTDIKIKIRPKNYSQTASASKQNTELPEITQRNISKKNAQILNEEAEHTDDIKLREILLRLAKHSSK